MKRFGFPRTAFLIGFVLARKVEESVYQTITVYGLSFLERPIVIALLIATLLSIVAVFRFKPTPPELAVDGPHTHNRKLAQLIFSGLLLAATAYLLVDSLRYDYLTAIYPQFAGILGLLFLMIATLRMAMSSTPSTVLYDSENAQAAKTSNSAEHYIVWLIGMLLLSSLTGFVIGVGVFILLFLRIKARENWFKSLAGALCFILFRGILSDRLTLRYPEGLLQTELKIALPWPLQ